MKLTLIGGAGVRVPLMVNGLIRHQDEIGIKQLVLYDSDRVKLNTIGTLAKHMAKDAGASFTVEVEESLHDAVVHADFIYSAIRVGGEQGRVTDERVALKHGILGQETTGAGGFAMALRTIPVMLDMAKVIEKAAPDAWLINFTNPSGLITEALKRHTNVKVIGICDAPSGTKTGVAKFLDVDEARVSMNYFGLNHLGWTNRVLVDGKDQLDYLLSNYESFVKTHTHLDCFSKNLVNQLRLIPNEYLFYYYYREEAVENINAKQQTRGEQVQELNSKLLKALDNAATQEKIPEAIQAYKDVMNERDNSYMSTETDHKRTHGAQTMDSEGYEGLALSILRSIWNNENQLLILNVQNQGIIPFLERDDVIEVSCMLNENGPMPYHIGEVPTVVKGLMTTVKEYERLTIESAVERNREKGIMALTIHPLVNSYTKAEAVFEDYIDAHEELQKAFEVRGKNDRTL